LTFTSQFDKKFSFTMDDTRAIDIKTHLHPFTMISETRPPNYIIEQASGVRICDSSGKEYLDAMSGLWCVNIGYGDQRIISAMMQASTRASFAHTMFGASNEYVARLADKLIDLSPGDCMRKVFFGHSGSDANDTNLKIARLYFLTAGQPQRTKSISCHRAYHGTTVATASLSGLQGHHRNFDLPEVGYIHVSPPDTFGGLSRLGFESEEAYGDWLVDELEAAIIKEGHESVAAFVAEPIIAVGGILFPPAEYFPKVKQLLDKYGILLIIDDVVCSFGRIGHWFGWETTGVEPDLVTIAKGMTSGYVPMSASIIGTKVWSMFERNQDSIGVLGHGFTMSGHPMAAAAVLANIAIIEEENLLDAAKSKGEYLICALRQAFKDLSYVANVRGSGLLVGIELVETPGFTNAQAAAVTVVNGCIESGVIVRALLGQPIIALAPPLIISIAEIDHVVETINTMLRKVLGHSGQ
jgi:L-2,4-diaminobutyrate transaminase